MIQLHQLSKSYKTNEWALRKLDLTIGKGMFGLLGPNGAGKTTLMRILATLMRPTEGTGTVNGRPLTKPEEIREIVGYLPQYFQIYPQLTGREFLEYAAVMKGIGDRGERKRQIAGLLDKVNLTDKANRKIKSYSGGMKQRLGIAQALLGSPEVIIVDEPTAGLDPEERVRFRHLLGELSLQRIVILSTHIVADIESSCQQAAVLSRGSLRFCGSLEELQAHGENRVWEMTVSEREFAGLSPLPIVASRRTGSGIHCRIISPEAPAADAVTVPPTLEDGYLALIGGNRHE
ncbi:ABC transporter ATP-binding protein [Paenibacillus sp. CC-CFT747]|nr:ABC transporter ATP-binding protein [Paenibacillus sp. CC-CFT747]